MKEKILQDINFLMPQSKDLIIKLNEFVEKFLPYLCNYTEYSFSPDKEFAGLMTMGNSKELAGKIYNFTETKDKELNKIINNILNFYPFNLVFKVNFYPASTHTWSIYTHYQFPIDPTFLNSLHLSGRNFLEKLFTLLNINYFYIGLSYAKNQLIEKIFLPIHLKKVPTKTLINLLSEDKEISSIFYPYLISEELGGVMFISFPLIDKPSLKIDYPRITPIQVKTLFTSLNYSSSALEKINKIITQFQLPVFNYMGIKKDSFNKIKLKFYFLRRYIENEITEKETLSNIFTSFKWC